MNDTTDLQTALLDKVLAHFDKRSEAAQTLEQLLSLGRDSVARRLRGETALTPHEISILAKRFNISLDELLFGQRGRAIFSHNRSESGIKNFSDYLALIHQQIAEFNQLKNFRVRYASREIPIFIYMMFPKLLAFKLYVYGLTTWQLDYLKNRPFTFDLLLDADRETARQTANLYCSIPSEDYWTVTILEQTLNQLEYLIIEGRIVQLSVAHQLIESLTAMLDHAQAMAESGHKFLPGDTPTDVHGRFSLYYNEYADTNNLILATSDQVAGLYHTFDTPNFLFTSDRQICSTVERWFENTLGKSTAISVHSSKNRHRFFRRLNERVEKTSRKLAILHEGF
ncbi:MAG: hypothetical protein AAGA31_06485 [Bacteroidota bacterium]